MPPSSEHQNDKSPNQPVSGATASSGGGLAKAGQKSMIIKIIVALLIPPVGLIMVIIRALDKKRPRRTPGVAALLTVSILGIIGYLIIAQTGSINVKLPGINRARYDYQSNNSNEFSPTVSAGISFSKPTQFNSTAKKDASNYSTESFAHLGPMNYPLGYIFTFSYKDNHTKDAKYVKGVNDFMSGAVKNSYSKAYIDAIKKQVFDSYPGYSAQLGQPHKFTNANIKKNAWSFDLNILSSNAQIKPMQGKLVYVLGNGVIYYFSLMVTKDNWTPNMATWQTVLSSLKLNA